MLVASKTWDLVYVATAASLLSADNQGGWLAKHAPDSVESLAMHKKKVEEIRGWLELQKQPGLGCHAPRMLILSGALLWDAAHVVRLARMFLAPAARLPRRLSLAAYLHC